MSNEEQIPLEGPVDEVPRTRFAAGAHLTDGYLAQLIQDVRSRLLAAEDALANVEGSIDTGGDTLHFYVSETGSDDNDGLSEEMPKATIDGINDALPDLIKNIVVIHVAAGTIDVGAGAALSAMSNAPDRIVIVRGTEAYVAVDDNGGANYVATASATGALTVAGATWTDDEHKGFLVEIMSGSQAGYVVGAVRNDANVVETTTFKVDPGVGCEFRFVRPASEITSTVSKAFFGVVGANTGIHFQDLYISGTTQLRVMEIPIANWTAARVVIESTNAVAVSAQRSSMRGMSFITYDTGGVKVFKKGTPSLLVPTTAEALFTVSPINSLISGIYKGSVQCSEGIYVLRAIYVSGLVEMWSCNYNNQFSTAMISSNASQGPVPIFDGGILLDHCHGDVEGVEINRADAGPAIEIRGQSHVRFVGAATGEAANGFACLAHRNAYVELVGEPQIQGSSGELTLDNAVEASLWATVAAGTPVVDVATDLVVVRPA